MLLARRRRLDAESRPAFKSHTMICKLHGQWTLSDTCSELCPFVRTFIATADKRCEVHDLECNFQAELSISSSSTSSSRTRDV